MKPAQRERFAVARQLKRERGGAWSATCERLRAVVAEASDLIALDSLRALYPTRYDTVH